MALLSAPKQFEVLSDFGKDISARRQAFSLARPALVAAIAAIDQWMEDNTVAFNQALPVAARTGLTAAQKAQLFMAVATKRYEVSNG